MPARIPLCPFLLLPVVALLWVGCEGKQLPDVHWDSRNPMFDAVNNVGNSLAMQVQIRDRLNIHCPQYGPLSLPDQVEYSKIYMVSKRGYADCTLDRAHLVAECLTPLEQSYVTIVFREYTPNPGALEFTPGETYYFITTSDGSVHGIDHKKGGMCSRYNLRLSVQVKPRPSARRFGISKPSDSNRISVNSASSLAQFPEMDEFVNAFDAKMIAHLADKFPIAASSDQPSQAISISSRSGRDDVGLKRPETIMFWGLDPNLVESGRKQVVSAGDQAEQRWREGKDYIVEYSSYLPLHRTGHLSGCSHLSPSLALMLASASLITMLGNLAEFSASLWLTSYFMVH